MHSEIQKIQHLYQRAGFGPAFLPETGRLLDDEINSLFKNSLKIAPFAIKGWSPEPVETLRKLNEAEKVSYRKEEQKVRIRLNSDILERFAAESGVLREKMTLFWMGHFACRIVNPVFIVKYFNTLNTNALGKFPELLRAMIRDAALLRYLNNNQNLKTSPNENFARELMELFTLGVGNYSEMDVKEGARALTGWGYDRNGEFLIRKQQHDEGLKVFQNKEGNFDGDDLVNIILSNRQCARFITSEIYRFFVNELPDETIIENLSQEFYNSGYDIAALMRSIFSADWFYSDKHIGQLIKSPVGLLVGFHNLYKLKFENPVMPIQIQKILGQVLFDPPNVAGWPGGRSWIDSSSLMYRMRLPEMLLQDAESIFTPKEEYDALENMTMGKKDGGNRKRIKTIYDLKRFEKQFTGLPESAVNKEIMTYLLSTMPGKEEIGLIDKLTSGSSGSVRIFKTAIYTMCLPEFQLC